MGRSTPRPTVRLGFEGGWVLEQIIGSRAPGPVRLADVARGLRQVIDAGAEMILLNPVGDNVAADREQMERLAAEVIPRLC